MHVPSSPLHRPCPLHPHGKLHEILHPGPARPASHMSHVRPLNPALHSQRPETHVLRSVLHCASVVQPRPCPDAAAGATTPRSNSAQMTQREGCMSPLSRRRLLFISVSQFLSVPGVWVYCDPNVGQKSYAIPRGFESFVLVQAVIKTVAPTRRRHRQARDEKGDRERRRLYLYSRSAISRSAAHDETRRRHLCYCGNE
jgi:hypothetical protein